jgi:hypothetical protein
VPDDESRFWPDFERLWSGCGEFFTLVVICTQRQNEDRPTQLSDGSAFSGCPSTRQAIDRNPVDDDVGVLGSASHLGGGGQPPFRTLLEQVPGPLSRL